MSDEQQIQYMTQDKIEDLKRELQKLKDEVIPSLAKRIDDARQMGDLSENAEYHAAREDMSWAQSRVQEINYILSNAVIIEHDGKHKIVTIGSQITVKTKGIKKEYSIVGAQEANPLAGKISNESPLGSSFLGKKKGEKIMVKLPAGVQEYEITDIH